MQRWNWFLAADLEGKWIMTKGYAEVTYTGTKLNASLKYETDRDSATPYHLVTAAIDKEGSADAFVSSPGREDIAPFRLRGGVFQGTAEDGTERVMILLTDGTTVIGLASGPRSDEADQQRFIPLEF